MKIGLISDTHIPIVSKEMPEEVKRAFRGVDLILHAGDIQVRRALDWLEEIAPVYAIMGNNDDDYDFGNDPRVKQYQVLRIDGLTIGMTHTFNYPQLPLEYFFRNQFKGPVDVVVYGDTHVPEVVREDGLLMVNPGSPTSPGPNMYIGLGHVGIMETKDGRADAWIVSLKELSCTPG